MCQITVATSIVPRNFDLQRAAMDTWLKLGFKVISLNCPEEATIVSQYFSDIRVKIVNRTAEPTTGKPYVFFDDVCAALTEEPATVCGVLNSDIFLKADVGFVDFISETAEEGLLFGSRIDVDSMTDVDGEKFIYGFDFFFFNKDVLKTFPKSEFCLGVPWWDYWAPFVPLVNGLACRELISPVAFHMRHETKWAGELFCAYGQAFADKISQCSQQLDFTGKIVNTSSPEQITLFSFDILQYILKKTDKVVFPKLECGNTKIEVGRSQYLSLREQVIKHNKRIWELNDRVNVANGTICELNARADVANNSLSRCSSALDVIRSSLSWRITKPLRWLGDLAMYVWNRL